MGVPLPGFIKGSHVGFTRVLVDYVFESLTCTWSNYWAARWAFVWTAPGIPIIGDPKGMSRQLLCRADAHPRPENRRFLFRVSFWTLVSSTGIQISIQVRVLGRMRGSVYRECFITLHQSPPHQASVLLKCVCSVHQLFIFRLFCFTQSRLHQIFFLDLLLGVLDVPAQPVVSFCKYWRYQWLAC